MAINYESENIYKYVDILDINLYEYIRYFIIDSRILP